MYTQFDRKLVTAFTGKAINNCASSTLNCLQWSQIKESHMVEGASELVTLTHTVYVYSSVQPGIIFFMHKKKGYSGKSTYFTVV